MYNDVMNQQGMNYPRYGYIPQQQPQSPAAAPYPVLQQIPQNYIKGRPVVSIDEARASQIDLDGSLYVFTDIGNGRIYTKQINPLTGTAVLNVFALTKDEPTSIPSSNYVTREELDAILADLKKNFSAPVAETKPATPQPKITANF